MVESQHFKIRIRKGQVLLDGEAFKGLIIGNAEEALDLSQRIFKQGIKLLRERSDDGQRDRADD